MVTKTDLAEVKGDIAAIKADLHSEIHSLRADVATDMLALETRLGDRITHLSRAVMEYHSSVIGHGVLYSDREERVRRIGARLDMAER